MIARYSNTTPALNKAPPIMSENQCTPEISLPVTIKTVNTVIIMFTHFLNPLFLMRVLNCIIAVGITHITSMVVDEG